MLLNSFSSARTYSLKNSVSLWLSGYKSIPGPKVQVPRSYFDKKKIWFFPVEFGSSCGKVMFTSVCHVSIYRCCLYAWQGACVAGGMCGRGHVWQGACMVGRGCAWQGCVWQGVCVAGCVCGRRCAWWGACVAGGVHGREGMCGRGHAWQGGHV